jgi:hypothetical protein
MNALESGADLIKKVVTGGPAVLWDLIVEKFSDFESMVVDEIKNFVVEKVVKAGISWLLGLLTPAGAFIKACQAIYSIVMFFVERGSQLKDFVESIIDTAGAVARGEDGGIAEKIENVMAGTLPLIISFLANLLGLGGIGDKVRSIIEKVQKPLGKAIDKVLDVVLKVTAPVWKGAKKLFNKGKELYGKAKDKAVAAYEKGKAKVKQVGASVKEFAKKGVAKVKGVGSAAANKAKQVGTAAKDKILGLLKPQKKATTMNGASHTLTAEPGKNGRFRVYMQSEKELLSTKLGRTIKDLERRAAGEEEPRKAKTLAQIAQLKEIAETSKLLESLNAEGKKVTDMGAPEGFETEMRLLSEKVKGFGDKNGVKDITASDAGTQVDMRLLARFGMPIPNYLQAQEVADKFGSMIDIRATAVGAPELLAKGFTPKSEKFKQKTMNKDDELLGLPPELRDRVVWFLPSRPKPEHFKDFPEDVLRRVWARWRQRKDEYYDNLAKMKKKLREGQVAVRPITNASSGGVVEESTKGIDSLIRSVGITGDHDVYQVHGNASSVIAALEKAPFRVQHGAHLDWPSAVREAEKRSLTPTEQRIFQAIVAKHLPGGESLLRINPHGPPTTANSSKLQFKLSGSEPPAGTGDDLDVVDAKEPGAAGSATTPEEASAAVKEQATTDLRAAIPEQVKSAASVQSTIDTVFAKHQKAGLHTIDVEPGPGGSFDVNVSASKKQKATRFWLEPQTQLADKDLRVRWSEKGNRATGIPHTALVAKWNGEDLHRRMSVDDDHHAEDELAAYVMANKHVLRRPPPGERDHLEVLLTKSPCGRCGERLRGFMATHNARLTIAPTGMYSPRDPEEKAAAREAIIQLKRAGAVIRVPTIDEVLAAYGGEAVDARSRKALETRLARMTKALDSINAEMAAAAKARAGR